MTKIMILEDSIDSLKALKAIVESVSKDIAVIPVKSLEEARAALQDEANLFQAFLWILIWMNKSHRMHPG